MSGLGWVSGELAEWERAGLLRSPRVIETASSPAVTIDGRSVVLLCSNNYLGLASDPRVMSAAAGAARRFGAGAGASRLVSGTTSIHRDLEVAIAAFEGAEDVVLFSSGYLANLGAITTLTGVGDVVFSDELNHASIVDACRLSKADVVVFRHADTAHLDELLASTPARRRVVVTDTVFSMDGDLAPLATLVAICERHDATLVVDEAHATGVLGPRGAGAVDALGLTGRVPVVVGTLSKALGSAGGYVATTTELATLIRNRARTHVFDTAASPPTIAAARAALDLVWAEPWRRERVRSLATRVASELRSLGFDARDPAAAIVPVLVGDAADACALSDALFANDVFCPAIRPPSVAAGTSRLRVTLMATHTDEHVERVLDAFAHVARRPDALHIDRPKRDAYLQCKGIFVTGTDTGIGKTIVTAAIAANLKRSGTDVAIYKPLQTGTLDGADDASYAGDLAAVSAYTGRALPDPLAPKVAAEIADETLALDDVTTHLPQHHTLVVEGAGGLLVPIDEQHTMADLARSFGFPIVVVARPALGTLNHTALTVEAARSRGLDVLGVVISGMPETPSLAERTNPAEIERMCGVPIVGVIPSLDGIDTERGMKPTTFEPDAWLGPELGGSFDRVAFLDGLAAKART